ncbi:methylated-DNA--[protein]-cysteine S-methyltransferase [Sediminivirga luteola]|uniref:methylated-DNA--[protein]-cysteine S-methyltransferase n=1 Tax=Sediminivirga luteola TaxID=1774748 RepID=A0A8J2XLS4_9MICO|nr:methylated-DNA--[protein]-cysteine S-methyltransferase [Sediminivirga luteola]MCI2265373.1 methylated-DNA--[protein]-cysteine S-methyltransferase [Sediminivirga luteola]GGA24464.1 putative methylated-DNA:protein-cysteine methyltransferase [Sediminivirga luteola]
MNRYPYATVETPDGPFTVIADADGAVLGSGWSADAVLLGARAKLGAGQLAEHPEPGVEELRAALHAVERYYAGEVQSVVTVPRAASVGTAFQQQVWNALTVIPPGAPLSYGVLAQTLGAPRAVRAVAAACGRNPAALFAPCHRVVGKDGSLTGFAFGIDIKRSLLRRESEAALHPSGQRVAGVLNSSHGTP